MSEPVTPHFTRAELEAALEHFRGTFLQTPPPFSAKKIAGTPAYRLARKHIAVELEPVEVQVFALDLLEFDGATARICVRCSAGTYVRGIAHDVGRVLGCGAFLTALRRTASGEFTESQARTLEALEELAREGRIGTGADSSRERAAGDPQRVPWMRLPPAKSARARISACRLLWIAPARST